MPKNRVTRKTATGGRITFRPCSKFRIGTRSSGKSALLMSTEDLKAVLNDKNKTRYHSKALTVLKQRGVEIEWPANLVKDHSLADLAQDMQCDSPG